MKQRNKIIAFILAFAIAFSIVGVVAPMEAYAATGSVLTDTASVSAWNTYFEQNYILGSVTEIEGVSVSLSSVKAIYWGNFNATFSDIGLGSMPTYDKLSNAASKFVSRLKYHDDSFFSSAYTLCLGRPVPTATVAYDSSLGVYRLRDDYSGLWLVNSAGHFPYYKEASGSSSPTLTYIWKYRSDVKTGTPYNIIPYADLKSIAATYNGSVKISGSYYLILDVTTSKILCTADGYPLAAIANLDSTAVDQTNNYYTQEGDTVYNEYQGGDTIINEGDQITNNVTNNNITNNSTTVYEGGDTYNNQFIDIEDNSIHLADGSIYNIDNLYYDESTKSYYVDSHDSYTYNSTTNEYVTNNYTFRIQYDIHYTSVTYIGQTEEYEADTYVYYYELPDGRSSADLTAEELEQLSLAFTDVVNYARSTDDADMRVLYHFDGNTEDSSYWSYCTEFDWVTGASLTYMDEGTFDGSLYLDETIHKFTITLPNTSDVTEDWTLQFHYYQSYTAAPSMDSYIKVGGTTVLQFNGAVYSDDSGTTLLGQTSVGSWNELCIMCSGGTLYWYINGVCVHTSTKAYTFSGSEILFYFGGLQQTYKKLDELRFTRRAVYTPGADYTPSAVPFDTNLTLILPDGDRPLADEVMVLTKSPNNLLTSKNLADWSVSATASNVKAAPNVYTSYRFSTHPFVNAGLSLYKNASYTSLLHDGQSTSMSVTTSAVYNDVSDNYHSGDYNYLLAGGLFLPLVGYYNYSGNLYSYWQPYNNITVDTNYCLSVLLSDGTYDYIVFKVTAGSECTYANISTVSSVNKSKLTLKIENLKCVYENGDESYTWYNYGVSISCLVGTTADIIYMELVKGSAPEFTVEWETAMYSSGELEESPVLAVRSNTPISTYQFGGVRPTYPECGQVWAMIESGRIVSLQQYTGSAWVEVDGRIWTGKRWIPYSSFDVFTLQDCWDMAGGGAGSDYEYIYSEAGFWSWLQKAWLKMLQKLDAIILALGGDPDALPGDGSGDDSDLTFWQRVKKIFEDSLAKIIESLLDLITKILDLVLGLVYDLLEFFFNLLTDVVVNGIEDFFAALTDEALLQFFHTVKPVLDENGEPVVDENGEPVTVTVIAMPDGVAGVFAFISATIMVLPDELRFALFFGMGALLLLAVLKLIRA